MQPRDWERLADESLWANYYELARSVTAQAALDYIATRYPKTTAGYIKQWYHNMHGNPANTPAESRMKEWTASERKQLVEYFSNGGGSVAEMANCKEYVRMALHGKPSRKMLSNITVLKKQSHRYFDTKASKKKSAPPPRFCLDCGKRLKSQRGLRCQSCARKQVEDMKRTAKFAVKEDDRAKVSEYNE